MAARPTRKGAPDRLSYDKGRISTQTVDRSGASCYQPFSMALRAIVTLLIFGLLSGSSSLAESAETTAPRFAIPHAERAPPYPVVAKRLQLEGTVVLKIYVNDRGQVQNSLIVSGKKPLARVASSWAVERWRFIPGKRAGKAAGRWMFVPVRFVLEK